MLVAQLAVVLNGAIDTVMAGQISAPDLAAVGIAASIYVTVFVSCMGVLLAVTPAVAHLYGAGRYAEIGPEVHQAAWLALVLALAGMVALWHPQPFLAFTRLAPDVEAKVRAYLAVITWSLPPALAFRIFYGFMSGIGRPRAVMAFNLLGLAAKIPLNAWFMIHLGMGAAGCAASTVAISWFTALAAWIWCARQPDCVQYALFLRPDRPRRPAVAALLRLGLPIGGAFLVDVTAFTFMALFIARLGATMSAAHQVAANLAVLCFMLPLAIGHAALVLAGHALGAGDPAGARHAGVAGLAVGGTVACVISAGLWLGADALVAIYTSDAEVRRLAASLVAIIAFYHFADAFQAVAVNVLRGYKKTTVPMMIYAVSLWGLGLGGGYVLGLTDWLGPARGAAGFWLAVTASLVLAGVLVIAYFLRVSQNALAPAATST